MSWIIETRDIPSDADLLWQLLATFDRLPQWMPGVHSASLLGSQQMGIGRRQRLIMRERLGEWEQQQVIIAWEPGRRLGWRTLSNQVNGKNLKQVKDLQTIVTLSQREGCTTVHAETSWIPVGLRGRLFSSLRLRPAVQRQLRETLRALENEAGRKGSS
jgi:uncharacterized membrane protein